MARPRNQTRIMSSRGKSRSLRCVTVPENKTAAESMDRSRRRHWQRFAALVALRLRLLRQRRGVEDPQSAPQIADQSVAVCAERYAVCAARKGKQFQSSLGIPNLVAAGQALAIGAKDQAEA